MSLEVGSLYVSVGAKINLGNAEKAFAGLAKDAKKLGKDLEQIGRSVRTMGLQIGAAFAGAAAVAAKSNAQVYRETTRIKDGMQAAAGAIGATIVPVLKQVADSVAKLANFLRSLTPAQRDMIANFAELAIKGIALGTAITKIGGALKFLGEVGKLVGPALFSILGALLPILAIGGAVAAVAFAIYEAWRYNFLGVRDVVAKVTDWIGSAFSKLREWFSTAWKGLRDVLVAPFEAVVTAVRKALTFVSDALAKVAAFAEKHNIPFLGGAAEFGKDVSAWLANLTTDQGLKDLWNDTRDVWQKDIPDAIGDLKSMLGKAWDSLKDTAFGKWISSLIDKFSGLKKQWDTASTRTPVASVLRKNERTFDPMTFSPFGGFGAGGVANDNPSLDAFVRAAGATGKDYGNGTSGMLRNAGLTSLVDPAKWDALQSDLSTLAHTDAESSKYLSEMKSYLERTPELLEAIRAQLAAQDLMDGGNRLSNLSTDEKRALVANTSGAFDASTRQGAMLGLAGEQAKRATIAPEGQLQDALRAVYVAGRSFGDNLGSAVRTFGRDFFEALKAGGSLLGDLIKNGIEGFKQAGVAGALTNIAGTLLQRSEGFAKAMEFVEKILQVLADAFGGLFEAMMPLLGAVSMVFKAIASALAPLFKALGQILAGLAPVLVVLSVIFQALAPILKVIADIIVIVLQPVLRIFFEAMRALGVVIVVVARIIVTIVKGILDVFKAILGLLASIPLIGGVFQGAYDVISKASDGLGQAMGSLDKAFGDLTSMSYDSAMAQANQAAAADDSAKAMQGMADAINGPDGLVVALARWKVLTDPNADLSPVAVPEKPQYVPPSDPIPERGPVMKPNQDPDNWPIDPETGERIPPGRRNRRTGDPATGGGANITINVNGATDPKETARQVVQHLQREQLATSGSLYDPANRYGA